MYLFNADGLTTVASLTWVAFGTVDSWLSGGVPAVSVTAGPGTARAVNLSLPVVSSAMSAVAIYADLTLGRPGNISLQLFTQFGEVVSAPESTLFFGVVVRPDGVRQTLALTPGATNSGLVVATYTPLVIGVHQVIIRHVTQGLTSQSSSLLAYAGVGRQGGFLVTEPPIAQLADASMVHAIAIGPLTSGFMNDESSTCTSVWTADSLGNLVPEWNTVRGRGRCGKNPIE